MSKSMAQATAGGDAASVALVTLDGRYHITERIAAGGMGEVYRAHDAVLAREVAIKVLHRSLAGDQGFVDRFRREARAAATLNHPNLVTVFDWGAVDGVYYMVMEYVHGRSVREILNARGALAPAQAAAVLDQTLAALDHAHTRGIVHRDLKPENILDHDRRGREGHRPRAGARVRRREEHPRRRGHRDRAVPRARADPRRAGRPALRSVLARHRRRSSCSPTRCRSPARRRWRSRTSTCPTACRRPRR